MPLVIDGEGGGGGGGGGTSPPPSATVNNLHVVADSNLHGDVVSFSLSTTLNLGAVYLYRSQNSLFSSATAIATMTRTTAPQSFHDTDPVLPGGIWYYFVQVWNTDLSLDTVTGPVSVSLKSGNANAPNPLDWFDASHDASDGLSVEVHATINLVAGTDFAAVRIYVNGYHGVVADILYSESQTKRFSFKLQATGENVTLKATVLNSQGLEQLLVNALSKVIPLSAAATAPAKVANVSVVDGPGQTQVAFDGGLENNITAYRLYRVARGGIFSNAVLVQTIAPVPAVDRYVMNDAQRGAFQWYVTAVNAAGESLPSDAVWPVITFV